MGKLEMKRHDGDLVVNENMSVDFQEITGALMVKTGVKFSANKLETVGGYAL